MVIVFIDGVESSGRVSRFSETISASCIWSTDWINIDNLGLNLNVAPALNWKDIHEMRDVCQAHYMHFSSEEVSGIEPATFWCIIYIENTHCTTKHQIGRKANYLSLADRFLNISV